MDKLNKLNKGNKQSKRNKRRSLNKFNNQKGFTLVELVVVMAILSILGVAIYGFFHTSSNGYKRTEQEVDLLNEAQLTTNQFDNMIIDSTKGLDYAYDTATVKNVSITSDADIADPAAVVKKTFAVTNETEAYRIEWEKATKKVTVTKITPSGAGEPSLLAEYVSGFSVSLLRAKTQRVVEFHFDFLNGTQTYDINHNITMRNKVVVNGKAVTEYEDAPWWKITSVDIYYGGVLYTGKTIPVTVTGTQQTIDLTAQINGINLPATKKVTWMIGGNTDTSTIVTSTGDLSCTVTLGADEKSKRIAVTATADVKNEGDKTNAKASTYISMKDSGVGSDDRLIRGGDGYWLDVSDKMKPGDTVEWGFKSVGLIYSGGNVNASESSVVGKCIPSDLYWNSDCSDYKYKNPDWGLCDPDKMITLDPREDGKCLINAGTDYSTNLFETTAFQVAVVAKVKHPDGSYDLHQFGKVATKPEEVDKNDPLYMEQMYINIVKPDGSQFGDYGDVSEGLKVSEGQFRLFIKDNESISFKVEGHGYKILPDVTYSSGDEEGSFAVKPIYNKDTGNITFKAADLKGKVSKVEYKISIAGSSIYNLSIEVNESYTSSK